MSSVLKHRTMSLIIVVVLACGGLVGIWQTAFAPAPVQLAEDPGGSGGGGGGG